MLIENLRSAYRSLRSSARVYSDGHSFAGHRHWRERRDVHAGELDRAQASRVPGIRQARGGEEFGAEKGRQVRGFPLLPLQFIRWTKQIQSFESIALTGLAVNSISRVPASPETFGAMRITAGFFDTLKVRPQRGRWFTESEEKRGMPNVVILSDAFWRRRFSADPHMIGKKILLDDAPYEVVGITPPDLRLFRGHQLDPVIDLPERTDYFCRSASAFRRSRAVSVRSTWLSPG